MRLLLLPPRRLVPFFGERDPVSDVKQPLLRSSANGKWSYHVADVSAHVIYNTRKLNRTARGVTGSDEQTRKDLKIGEISYLRSPIHTQIHRYLHRLSLGSFFFVSY